jgi:hypothetical protein
VATTAANCACSVRHETTKIQHKIIDKIQLTISYVFFLCFTNIDEEKKKKKKKNKSQKQSDGDDNELRCNQ